MQEGTRGTFLNIGANTSILHTGQDYKTAQALEQATSHKGTFTHQIPQQNRLHFPILEWEIHAVGHIVNSGTDLR